MNAFQIANEINASTWKPRGVTVICKFINGSEVTRTGGNQSTNEDKREYAYNSLFKNARFSKIIGYINNVWLDPAYHFYITR